MYQLKDVFHLRIHLEQFFQRIGIILEAADNIDTSNCFVVAVVRALQAALSES